jgi:hypothetical protein
VSPYASISHARNANDGGTALEIPFFPDTLSDTYRDDDDNTKHSETLLNPQHSE